MKPTYTDNEGNAVEPSTMIKVIDMQRNNRILTALTIAIYIMIAIVLWLIYYVIKNNVLNNVVATCGKCIG